MHNRTFKILFACILLLIINIVAVWTYYKWRISSIYEDEITLTAYYMKYACGECSIDMKVESVDNTTYNFIIGKDIFPTPKSKSFSELCDYISTIGFESSTGPDYIEEPFVLVGYLHKYPHEWPWPSCSETPYFTVKKLKYGAHGKWITF